MHARPLPHDPRSRIPGDAAAFSRVRLPPLALSSLWRRGEQEFSSQPFCLLTQEPGGLGNCWKTLFSTQEKMEPGMHWESREHLTSGPVGAGLLPTSATPEAPTVDTSLVFEGQLDKFLLLVDQQAPLCLQGARLPPAPWTRGRVK